MRSFFVCFNFYILDRKRYYLTKVCCGDTDVLHASS
jgi:hypothetical protein